MKTKIQFKGIFVFALFTLLFSFKGHTQDSLPTKEETITWLKDKLTKHFENILETRSSYYCYYSLESVDIKECEIIYKVNLKTPLNGGTTSKYTYTVPTKGLNIGSEGSFWLNYDGIQRENTSTISSDGSIKELSIIEYISGLKNQFGINTSGEEDLVNRIQKAITHLATFCPEKEKEKF